MVRWFKFNTTEVEVLKDILDDDITTTASYEDYLDGEIDCADAQGEVIEAIGRRTIAEGVVEQLEKGGEER